MSQSKHNTIIVNCDNCDRQLPLSRALTPPGDDEFCSTECYHRHKGANIQRQIRTDHTRCATCYAERKKTSHPSEDWKHKHESPVELVLQSDGQYHDVDGEIALDATQAPNRKPTATDSIIGFEYLTENIEYANGFSYCKCGNVRHSTESEELRNIELQEVIVNLWGLLKDYYDKGQFGDNKPDKQVLFDTLKESDMDFELSIGKAVYGQE